MSEIKKIDSKDLPIQVEDAGPVILGNQYDDLVSRLLASDKTPWYKKPNLRRLYLLFIGSVLCVETTSGYDASVLNGLQAVPRWTACEYSFSLVLSKLTCRFQQPSGYHVGSYWSHVCAWCE